VSKIPNYRKRPEPRLPPKKQTSATSTMYSTTLPSMRQKARSKGVSCVGSVIGRATCRQLLVCRGIGRRDEGFATRTAIVGGQRRRLVAMGAHAYKSSALALRIVLVPFTVVVSLLHYTSSLFRPTVTGRQRAAPSALIVSWRRCRRWIARIDRGRRRLSGHGRPWFDVLDDCVLALLLLHGSR